MSNRVCLLFVLYLSYICLLGFVFYLSCIFRPAVLSTKHRRWRRPEMENYASGRPGLLRPESRPEAPGRPEVQNHYLYNNFLLGKEHPRAAGLMAVTKTEKKDLFESNPQRGHMILSLTRCRRYNCFGKCDMDKSVTAGAVRRGRTQAQAQRRRRRQRQLQ